jgi:hypothetical protein
MVSTLERRRFPRQALSLVMQIGSRLSHAPGLRRGRVDSGRISVVTSNIGPGGVLFQTPHWRMFPVGGRVDFAVFLPGPFGSENWHCFRFSGSGTVTRHEKRDGTLNSDWRGVAVTFDTPIRLR